MPEMKAADQKADPNKAKYLRGDELPVATTQPHALTTKSH